MRKCTPGNAILFESFWECFFFPRLTKSWGGPWNYSIWVRLLQYNYDTDQRSELPQIDTGKESFNSTRSSLILPDVFPGCMNTYPENIRYSMDSEWVICNTWIKGINTRGEPETLVVYGIVRFDGHTRPTPFTMEEPPQWFRSVHCQTRVRQQPLRLELITCAWP